MHFVQIMPDSWKDTANIYNGLAMVVETKVGEEEDEEEIEMVAGTRTATNNNKAYMVVIEITE